MPWGRLEAEGGFRHKRGSPLQVSLSRLAVVGASLARFRWARGGGRVDRSAVGMVDGHVNRNHREGEDGQVDGEFLHGALP